MLEINEKTIEDLQTIVLGLLSNMGANGKIHSKIIESQNKELISLNIETDEADILIGSRGSTLVAFQHLARVLFARSHKNEIVPFVIDVNDYKSGKEKYLQGLAQSVARKVKVFKKEVTLPPMSAYERRIIHVHLKEDKEIETQSIGEEPQRKIVVKLTSAK